MSALPQPLPADPAAANGLAAAGASLSPSLGGFQRRRAAAYEIKFLLTEKTAQQVEQALRSRMQLDPYADRDAGGAYTITSTYLDTPRFDVFHRIGRHRYRKLRLRRYGDAPWRFLEQKFKRKDRVHKYRSRADEAQLAFLGAPLLLESWEGAWFHRQAARWGLSPVCEVSYLRRAYFAEDEGSPLRLTFDRELRARRLSGWQTAASSEMVVLGDGEVICEFKFRGAMPACFREVVADIGIAARGASKYRRSALALGLASFDAARSGEHA